MSTAHCMLDGARDVASEGLSMGKSTASAGRMAGRTLPARKPGRVRWLCLAAVLAFVGGCAEIRLFTYPSEFIYLDEQGVQDIMHEMASNVRRLNTLASAGPWQPGDQSRLSAMDAQLADIAAMLGALGVGAGLEIAERDRPQTNHLLIDDHVDEFLADVERARLFLQADPPDLFPAGSIAASCDGCHRFR